VREYYRIHELAQLFGLCPDTLRYYEERGLLHPVRGENRYRMYGIQDIITLNIIRSLRDLNLPTGEIRSYLERRTVEETLALLDREEEELNGRIAALERARKEACRRRTLLEAYAQIQDQQVEFLQEPERPCVFLQENVILEGEIDFLLKKLESRHQDYIKVIGGQCMGAAIDGGSLKRGVYNHFSRVFFLTQPGLPCDGALPGGTYARLFYRGDYHRLEEHWHTLLRAVEEAGRTPDGAPLELYRIDAHDTNRVEEYVTELQVRLQSP